MPNWAQGLSFWMLLDFYLIFILVLLILRFVLHNKRMFSMFIFYLFLLAILWLSSTLELPISKDIYMMAPWVFLFFMIIIGAPDIRLTLESLWKETAKSSAVMMGSDRTKNEIIKAVTLLSKNKIGGLITIEKFNTLDQYSERAIMLNADVSHELLINIFTPNTPLHDGAVIVRGDKILCAGAYYVLTSNENFEKTTGSRHRAALGISEITDSLTVIVSEETGSISIAINGVMTKMKDENALNEYLSLFMK
ncbi:diadenylate cyclase [Acholeplasma equifetale]|uniref:diadenylate cyclase n=1 Tax=Acholeplasma equifetale TaxID=264634 RepID=UPI000AF358BB|nr:DNA integrity scanning protein DisA nucleotide-binding domain protein [Acholeplasma equifetale]